MLLTRFIIFCKYRYLYEVIMKDETKRKIDKAVKSASDAIYYILQI
nr:MAG TPA: hypothetical protein [Caudoviricetes sp.]